jgi:hypothetical protein
MVFYAVRAGYFFFAFRRRRRLVLRAGFAALALRRFFLLFVVIGIERLPHKYLGNANRTSQNVGEYGREQVNDASVTRARKKIRFA